MSITSDNLSHRVNHVKKNDKVNDLQEKFKHLFYFTKLLKDHMLLK